MQKALHLGERALELATTDDERAEALERAGMGSLGLGLGTPAWRYLCEAVDILATMGPQSRTALVRVCARAVEIPTRWPGSMDAPLPPEEEVDSYLQLGLSNLDDERAESGVRLRIARAFVPFSISGKRTISEEEWRSAEAVAMRAVETARSINRVDLESAALDAAGSTFFGRGLYADAVPVDDRRTGLLDDLDDPGEIGDIYAVNAWSRTMIGEYRAGVEFSVQGIAKVADLEESPPVIQHLGAWEAQCRLALGEWDEVTDRLHPAVVAALGDRAEDPPGFSLPLFGATAFIWSARGDERARPLEDLVARMVADYEEFPAMAVWNGLLLARRGNPEGGLAFVKQARAESAGIFRPFAGPVIALLLAQTGSWDEVPAFLERSRAYVERSRVLALPVHLDRLEGRHQLARGDVPEAVETLRRAADGFQRLEMPWEHACNALSLAEALRLADRNNEATAKATAALEVFEGLRSMAEIEQARGFLN
jgi:hypothetical protein